MLAIHENCVNARAHAQAKKLRHVGVGRDVACQQQNVEIAVALACVRARVLQTIQSTSTADVHTIGGPHACTLHMHQPLGAPALAC